jgi:hypothetical protein
MAADGGHHLAGYKFRYLGVGHGSTLMIRAGHAAAMR